MRSFSRIAGAAVVGAEACLVDVQVSIAGELEGGVRLRSQPWTTN